MNTNNTSINYNDKILFLGAHSDDVEIGCGGIASLFCSQGCKIAFATATDCGEDRKEETREAAKILSLFEENGTLYIGSIPDGQLDENEDQLAKWLNKIKAKFNPSTIFCHHEYDTHKDHSTLYKVTRRIFTSCNLIQYHIPKMISQQASFIPNIIEDITEFIDKKNALCQCHGTQQDKSVYLGHIKERAAIQYTECYGRAGGYAEGFIATLISSRVLKEQKEKAAYVVNVKEKNIFQLIDANLVNTKYFPIYPPIDVKDNRNTNIKLKINQTLPDLKINPPEPEGIIKEILGDDGIYPANSGYNKQLDDYLNRYSKGNFFHGSENLIKPNEIGNYEMFLKIISDRSNLNAVKKSNLVNYLKRAYGFHFNGEKFALDNFIYTRNQMEQDELILYLRKTDYYTYRVISDFSSKMINLYGFDKKLNYGLLEYMGNHLEKNIHLGVSVSILVHCIRDNSLILTRRSSFTANPTNEAGLYFSSANEGINISDQSQKNNDELLPIFQIIKRALHEEIIGTVDDESSLLSQIESCDFTGMFLYLPNMSVSLCFCVSIDCESVDIRNSYKFARDSGFEHSMIVDDRTWNKHTGLPSFSKNNIYNFLSKTIKNEELNKIWDEGAAVTFVLSTLSANCKK